MSEQSTVLCFSVNNVVVTFYAFKQTLEAQYRRPFHLARESVRVAARFPLLVGQFSTIGGLSIIALDAMKFTSSTKWWGTSSQ